MRILLGHNYYQQPGGEDAVFKAEVLMLKKHGHDVCVYERHNAEVRADLFSKIRQLFSFRWSKRSYDEVRALIREFKPDVAHFHNTFFMMTPSVYDACRDEGVFVVQSLHNFRPVCMNGLFLKGKSVCLLCTSASSVNGVLRRCYRGSFVLSAVMADMINYHWKRRTWADKVDRFIVASEFTRSEFIRLGFALKKIVVKPHFVDESVIGERKIDGKYVLYAGRLSEEKGIDVLLRAWAEMKEIPLYIAGSGPLKSHVEEVVKRQGLEHVRVFGFLDHERYEEIFSEASAVIVPSLCYENFPRVVVEAYARGIAVIASRSGSLQEVVRDQATGALFTAGDPDDLCRCVRDVWKNSRYLQFGKNARDLYRARYTEEINHDALLNIYSSAAK
jgi:glycosyltransferase involved in cell wall biosynthesis